ncbi:helix-turn-helix transcriptional regulator [Mammaliicoccus sciuri]|uniref:helix-turn-helix transcriptional regulator n=1 Tax=Mammaliicoccus sciuri TaxID=1296 RepID=UPI001D0D55F0|nr:helix-turn-helix transcriptional regulator [Mammaliicoccus sciuri]MCC2087949.1 helix-turn-helix transcriptional regulator [Mammaliicoccus sciuri]
MNIVAKTDDIKIRMAELEIRQDELANNLNVTRPYLNALINGRKNSWRQAYRLSKELGGTIEEFFIVED